MSKLYKSSYDKKLCGICSGVAKYINIDSTVIRLIWAILSIFTGGFGLMLYVILAFILPYDYEE